MQPPVMPDDGNTTRVTTGTDALPCTGKESSALEPIWDDEDTKAFYESLPDLRFTFHEIDNLFHYLASFYYSFEFFIFTRAFVPAVLLGEVEPKSNEQHAKGREQSSVRL